MTEPIDIVKSYNAALFEAQVTGVRNIDSFLSDATVCIESPAVPWGGRWVGPSGFAELFDAPQDFEIVGVPSEEFWADGSTVFHRMSLDIVHTSSGDRANAVSLELYEVLDERIASIECFFFDPTVFTASG